MNAEIKDYIELERTFFELPKSYSHGADGDDLELSEALGLRVGKDHRWSVLLSQHRVILLAEAGSGKTEEIRHVARNLRKKKKPAFFIRLEHISSGFEGAFEEGSYPEFQDWLESNNEGWLLLDSVDEARLRHPQDFEQAIRKIASILNPAIHRTHIVITGRVDAWRSKTDLDLCNRQLQFKISQEANHDLESEEDVDFEEDELASEAKMFGSKSRGDGSFSVYSISNLSTDQVAAFARGKGVSDVLELLQEIDRRDAWAYTTRPQDLLDVIEFWNANRRIGSRLELIKNSIERRLDERRENTAASDPLSPKQVRQGVKLIAMAATLMKESAIRVPDGSENTVGISVHRLLPDWASEERKTLLGRPIFDKAIYGAVRFHHRSVREYLTAESLHDLLEQGAPRKVVEQLFFCKKYGVEILVPSMRPVLSWLVIFDDKFRKKACALEPEIVLEGGDPSELPVGVRRKILIDVCKNIDSDIARRSVSELSAVQRFANLDLASDIKSLVETHKENAEIISFLMRMIWQGQIREALPEAKKYALDDKAERYTRIAAIRAVKEIGSEADFEEVLKAILAQDALVDRQILSETVDHLDASKQAIGWIFQNLENTRDKEEYSSDGLSYSLVKFVGRLKPDDAYEFVRHADRLLAREPFVERRFCQVSKQYGWLLNCGAKAVEILISSQHPESLSSESLSILLKIPPYGDYADCESGSVKPNIAEQAATWTDLKFALFWKDVETTRKYSFNKKDERITRYWQASTSRPYLNFEEGDFGRVTEEISSKEFLDDKLVALSLAFQIYKENGRPRKWRENIKVLVDGTADLEERLSELLHPPAQSEEQKKWKRQEYRWKKRSEEREDRRKRNHADWRQWLNENYEKLRDKELIEGAFSKGSYLKAQYYLLGRMRKLGGDSAHWTQGNWHDLIDAFDEEIAKAFRDGLLLSWRYYKPQLLSEGKEEGSTPYSVIFGLSGLAIEARETDNWLDGFTDDDVRLACRYAFQELNGFPNWFPKLHKQFPKLVSNCVLEEIDWELAASQEGKDKHYIIDKTSWSGQALWDDLAPDLLQRLDTGSFSSKNLGSLLKIVQSSSIISNQAISQLASRKYRITNEPEIAAQWFAAWIGVDPTKAIRVLTKHLKAIAVDADAVLLAMSVIVNLVGERRMSSHAREGFKTPAHLKDLYLLMHKYIKIDEDTNRVGGGAYTPELRDDAQDSRNGLYSILKDIPGKKTYLALKKLAKKHPTESARAWMMHSARERAEKDADLVAMTYEQFISFNKSLNTQSNHWTKYIEFKPSIFWVKIHVYEILVALRNKYKSR